MPNKKLLFSCHIRMVAVFVLVTMEMNVMIFFNLVKKVICNHELVNIWCL